MKKNFFISTCLVLLFIFSNISAYHAATISPAEKVITIYSEQCPQEVTNYAISSYMRFASSYVSENQIDCTTVSLGNPFTIENSNTSGKTVFFFPIFHENTIIATFQVYEDSVLSAEYGRTTYSGVMTPALSSELNTLIAESTSRYYILAMNRNKNLTISMASRNETLSLSTKERSLVKSTITDKLSTGNLIDISSRVSLNGSTPNYGFVDIDFTDIQDEATNWCGAHATAAIIRCMRGSPQPKAETLMSLEYPNGYDELTSFPISAVLAAGEDYGYTPTFANYMLGSSTVINEILNGRPLFIAVGCYKIDEYTNEEYRDMGHACVLRGFAVATNVYTIWDPLNEAYSVIDMSTGEYYIVQALETFEWDRTVYGW